MYTYFVWVCVGKAVATTECYKQQYVCSLLFKTKLRDEEEQQQTTGGFFGRERERRERERERERERGERGGSHLCRVDDGS